MDLAKRRPVQHVGKAVVQWEEMGMSTIEAAGVGIQARRERFAEITSGRSYFQQGLTATCKDSPLRFEPRWREDLGLTHESVGAMKVE